MFKITIKKQGDLLHAGLSQVLEDHLRQKVALNLASALSRSSPESTTEGISDGALRAVLDATDDYMLALEVVCDTTMYMVCRSKFVFVVSI